MVEHSNCPFVFRKPVAMFDNSSKISCHVNENTHKIDFNAVKVVAFEPNFHGRLFLEAWWSIKDPQSGNHPFAIPEVYKSLALSQVSRHFLFFLFKIVHITFFSARVERADIFKSRVTVLSFQLMKAKALAKTS